jgi:hypothetical protein
MFLQYLEAEIAAIRARLGDTEPTPLALDGFAN